MRTGSNAKQCAVLWFIAMAGLMATVVPTSAQDTGGPKARPEDVKSPSAIVRASYEAISGPAGQELNLDRFRSLFLPQAQLVSVSHSGSQASTHVMTLEAFTEMVIRTTGREGHVEHEIAERTEEYGNIAHVWSSYESRRTPDDPHVTRGINSIQLMNDGKRWWISGAQWQHETPDIPLPAEYLSAAH
jgi:hypothetical protein